MVGGDVFLIIEREAEARYNKAAYGGSMDDDGAKSLRDQVKFYKYGREGLVPPEWEIYVKQAQRESDPEYAELMRLKKKFGKQ